MNNLEEIKNSEIDDIEERMSMDEIEDEYKFVQEVALNLFKVNNILYFIANTDIYLVCMVLDVTDCNLELFEGITHYDYSSIKRQYEWAKQFKHNKDEESIAKYKACAYLLYKKTEGDVIPRPHTKEQFQRQINLNYTALRIAENTLQEFLDRVKSNRAEHTTIEAFAKTLFNVLYKNMKKENWITKEELNKLLD